MVTNCIVLVVILGAVLSAVCYIVKERKKGKACIGCPNGLSCSKCKH